MRTYTSVVTCIFLFCAATLPVSCFKNLTEINSVYENNFESKSLPEIEVVTWNSSGTAIITVTEPRITDFNGSHMLGKFNNGYFRLTLDKLPVHQLLRAEFDLYVHDKWTNDLWKLEMDGALQLLTGFSNFDTVLQSYPNWLGNGSALSPAGKNAINLDLPGACVLKNSPRGSSMYRIIATIQHTNSKATVLCGDAGGFFNDTCQRSWAVDNLKVTVLKNY